MVNSHKNSLIYRNGHTDPFLVYKIIFSVHKIVKQTPKIYPKKSGLCDHYSEINESLSLFLQITGVAIFYYIHIISYILFGFLACGFQMNWGEEMLKLRNFL